MRADTIFALATGAGRAGLAVIRISGDRGVDALVAMTGRPPPPPRRATRRRLHHPAAAAAEVLDEALVLWFPRPASFTGEDVVELHVHGGRAVIKGVLAALATLPGMRPAEPGEFTRRAVGNGRLELTAAEGLADLVAAETAAQRRQALRQLAGGLGRVYDGWRERLIAALAHVEAAIDFSDEDLPDGLVARARAAAAALAGEIADHLADHGVGERIRDGIEVAVFGAPNAGKSTLVNTLARREVAIVSPRPGTTRDVIEVPLDIGGLPVILTDSAGLADSDDAVEAEGVRRARWRAERADVRLAVVDGLAWPAIDAATVALIDEDTLVVVSKADRAVLPPMMVVAGRPALVVSALTGAGLPALEEALAEALAARFTTGEAAPLTRLRHRQALTEALAALRRGAAAPAAEAAAEDLRLAAAALGRITGRVDVEAVLDVIFRDFCIGK